MTGGSLVPEVGSYVISENIQVVSLYITPDEDYVLDRVSLAGSENGEALYFVKFIAYSDEFHR